MAPSGSSSCQFPHHHLPQKGAGSPALQEEEVKFGAVYSSKTGFGGR